MSNCWKFLCSGSDSKPDRLQELILVAVFHFGAFSAEQMLDLSVGPQDEVHRGAKKWQQAASALEFDLTTANCAYLPKTAAGHCKWAEVLKDLEQIKTSKDIDVSLYTANTDEDKECQEPIMRCFFLEMKVIVQECYIKNCSKTQDVLNIWKNGNASLENNKSNSTTSAKCKECEEYEEKNFTEFIQSFVKVIQRECRH
ncbi:Il15 [Columba guinea]|nr:Il15 [Columba guinea]